MVLGLRNLISPGIMPINKSFLRFNIKSLLPPKMSRAIQNVSTQPKEGGANPNLMSTVRFEIEIPGEAHYAPRLAVDVFDMLFFSGMA
jgi:hypothetical protein